MGQDQGSCNCNSPKATSELQFGGAISSMRFLLGLIVVSKSDGLYVCGDLI